MPKAQINPIEQNSMVQGQASNLNYKPVVSPLASVAPDLERTAQTFAGTLDAMQQRNDKIRLNAFERKLSTKEKEFDLLLSQANSAEEIDRAYEGYTKSVKQMAQQELGKRLYDKWMYENNYFEDAAKSVADRAKFPVLQKQGLADINETIRQSAFDRSFTRNPLEKQAIDDSVMATLEYASSGANGVPAIIEKSQADSLLNKYTKDISKQDLLNDFEIYGEVETSNRIANKENYKGLDFEERKELLLSQIKKNKEHSDSVRTNPAVYVSFENSIKDGTFEQGKLNWAYTNGQITLTDKRALEKQAEEDMPTTKKQAVNLITAKFSASDMDANFGSVVYTRQKALQFFYKLIEQNPQANDEDIMGFAQRAIDTYETIDNETILSTLPMPQAALNKGIARKEMSKYTKEDIDQMIIELMSDNSISEEEKTMQVAQYEEWYPYLKNRDERAARKAAKAEQAKK